MRQAWMLPLIVVPWFVAGCSRLGPKQYLELAPTDAAASSGVDRAAEVLRSRLEGEWGVNVSVAQGRVRIAFPAKADRAWFERICTKRGELTFVLMPKDLAAVPNNPQEWEAKATGKSLTAAEALTRGATAFTGADLKRNASVVPSDTPNSFDVRFEFTDGRKGDFKAYTGKHIGDVLAIVLDGKVLMAPVIRSAIPGVGVINGQFSAQEATDLRRFLNSGPLPIGLRVADAVGAGAKS